LQNGQQWIPLVWLTGSKQSRPSLDRNSSLVSPVGNGWSESSHPTLTVSGDSSGPYVYGVRSSKKAILEPPLDRTKTGSPEEVVETFLAFRNAAHRAAVLADVVKKSGEALKAEERPAWQAPPEESGEGRR
jgi:hypothetical protein